VSYCKIKYRLEVAFELIAGERQEPRLRSCELELCILRVSLMAH